MLAPDRPTTAVLLASARTDPAAVGALFEWYRPYLTLLARIQIGRRLRGKSDAADIVQETYLDAYRQFAAFRGETPDVFAAWLRHILVGQIAALVRRYCHTQARDVNLEQTLRHELDSSSDRIIRLADTGTSPSGVVSGREEQFRLAAALEQLPPDYREVILLRQIEGRPFTDVATAMGRTEDSVQKLWVRGLEALRRSLGATPMSPDPG